MRVTIFFLLIFGGLNAQTDIFGEIQYSVHRFESFKAENPNSQKARQFLEETAKNAGDDYIKLLFNNNLSISFLEEKLDNEGDKWSNFRGAQIEANGNFYFDSSNKELINQKDALGQKFLIKTLKKREQWELFPDKKQIGKYTCNKAVRVDSLQGWNKTVLVNREAWYTTEIPVPFGPISDVGLPGLILEVVVTGSSFPHRIIAEEIKLNPTKKTTIALPSKGKVVSKREYEEFNNNALKEIIKNSQ